eukprot:235652-Prymnesium_polylepis.1
MARPGCAALRDHWSSVSGWRCSRRTLCETAATAPPYADGAWSGARGWMSAVGSEPGESDRGDESETGEEGA